MKKTVEKLTETTTRTRKETGADGYQKTVSYEARTIRPIKLVTGWLRFGHYLIDMVIIGVLFFVLDNNLDLTQFGSFRFNLGTAFQFNFHLSQYLLIVVYYVVCESLMQQTIGKLATETVVINERAEKPEIGSLIVRSLSRIIPFEAISCLGDRGWHDKFSKTYVVKKEERDQLIKLLNAEEGVFVSESKDLLD
jgi:uncharacterized RDD family membrane protein YckC